MNVVMYTTGRVSGTSGTDCGGYGKGYGDGYGDSDGGGYGNGDGNGYGAGDGYGNGNGYGAGDGAGNGEGYSDGGGYGNGKDGYSGAYGDGMSSDVECKDNGDDDRCGMLLPRYDTFYEMGIDRDLYLFLEDLTPETLALAGKLQGCTTQEEYDAIIAILELRAETFAR